MLEEIDETEIKPKNTKQLNLYHFSLLRRGCVPEFLLHFYLLFHILALDLIVSSGWEIQSLI